MTSANRILRPLPEGFDQYAPIDEGYEPDAERIDTTTEAEARKLLKQRQGALDKSDKEVESYESAIKAKLEVIEELERKIERTRRGIAEKQAKLDEAKRIRDERAQVVETMAGLFEELRDAEGRAMHMMQKRNEKWIPVIEENPGAITYPGYLRDTREYSAVAEKCRPLLAQIKSWYYGKTTS